MKFYFRKLNKIKLQQKLDPQEVIRFSEQSALLEAEGLDVGSRLLTCCKLFRIMPPFTPNANLAILGRMVVNVASISTEPR